MQINWVKTLKYLHYVKSVYRHFHKLNIIFRYYKIMSTWNKPYNLKELQHVTGVAKLSELYLGLTLHFKDVYVLTHEPCTFSWGDIFTSVSCMIMPLPYY